MSIETIKEALSKAGFEPYHEEPAGLIYCGDCLDIMPHILDGSIDLVVTDPPYGIELDYTDKTIDGQQEWIDRMTKFIPQSKRLSGITIMPCSRFQWMKWWYDNFPPDWLICWYKGSPGHRAFVGFNDWEPHLVFGKNKSIQYHDYFQTKLVPANNGHPCPKPIEWARWLISKPTNDGIVLDPFLGSGTTAVAAKQLGRKFIGIEIEPKYCDIAKQRLSQEELF